MNNSFKTRNGTLRSDRVNEYLLNSGFEIDDRSFEDIVGYIYAYLGQVNYFNVKNQPEGNWQELVKHDPIMLLVRIVSEPTNELERLASFWSSKKPSQDEKREAISLLEKWQKCILDWVETLHQMGLDGLGKAVNNIFRNVLLDSKYGLLSSQKGMLQMQTLKLTKDTLHKVPLNKALHAFMQIVIHIKRTAKKYLEEHLYNYSNLSPSNAMFYAFALLFKHVQSELNELHKKHLDFYYKDILKQEFFAGSQTRAIVNVDLLKGIASTVIGAGSQFSAGKPFGAKEEVIFETKEDFIAHNLTIKTAKTLYFNTNPVISVGTNEPITSSTIEHHLIASGKPVGNPDHWYVFGANKSTVRNSSVDPNYTATIGCVMMSPVLYLTEGDRSIKMTITMSGSASDNTFWTLVHQIKDNKRISLGTALDQVLRDGFLLEYTSADGWHMFNGYDTDYDEEKNAFILELSLNVTEPSLELPKKNIDNLSWPAIRLTLNETAPVYLFPFLNGVELQTIDFEVDVKGMCNLSIWNSTGKMPLGKPFELFGALPEQGSYFMLGKSELFQKEVSALNVHLEWDNLPEEDGGLPAYYAGYEQNFDNDVYKVRATLLSEGTWQPQLDRPDLFYDLYTTQVRTDSNGETVHTLARSTEFDIADFDVFGGVMDYQISDPLKYDINTRSGFIRFTLEEPGYGIGTKEYQERLVEIATYNAKHPKRAKPLPNKPYVPKVKKVSVDYTAKGTLFFGGVDASNEASGINHGMFYHLSPNGIEPVITDDRIHTNRLLANFNNEGYLYLDLEGVTSSITVSIYFLFLTSSSGVHVQKGKLCWEVYTLENTWQVLSDDDIVSDGTAGFQKSGIVQLKLPWVFMLQGQVYPTYRLRVSVASNAPYYPKVKGIYLNGVEVECTTENTDILGRSLPVNSIKKVVSKLPDVKSVNQYDKSYGGRTREQEPNFYNRVSERLRHKDRAITYWDYERLILENFEDVRVVKCTNFNEDFEQVAQDVKVVVLNNHWTVDERHYFDNGSLYRMTEFLQKRVNPNITVSVINPVPEYLLVNCVVEFTSDNTEGHYLQKLNQDISEFLSPVSNIKDGVGGIGGLLNPATLSGYIDNLPYVASLLDMNIEHIVRTGDLQYKLGEYRGRQMEIKASKPWAVLTPVAQHRIWVNSNPEGNMNVGIGLMDIGTDFILGKRDSYRLMDDPFKSVTQQIDSSVADDILVFNREK